MASESVLIKEGTCTVAIFFQGSAPPAGDHARPGPMSGNGLNFLQLFSASNSEVRTQTAARKFAFAKSQDGDACLQAGNSQQGAWSSRQLISISRFLYICKNYSVLTNARKQAGTALDRQAPHGRLPKSLLHSDNTT